MFEEHREPLYRFLYRLTRNACDAEDLLQETFLVVWQKREQFEGRGSLAGYLRRTAYRRFLNVRERDQRRAALAPTVVGGEGAEAAPRPDAENGEAERNEVVGFLVARVQEALEGLPAAAREAFVLFRYEGLTCAEIADAVDAPVKTIETRLARATHLLAQRLRPYRHHMSSL